jgi:hypothetical protein
MTCVSVCQSTGCVSACGRPSTCARTRKSALERAATPTHGRGRLDRQHPATASRARPARLSPAEATARGNGRVSSTPLSDRLSARVGALEEATPA